MAFFDDLFSGFLPDPNVDLDHDGYDDAYAREIDADGDGVSHLSLIRSSGIFYDGVAFDFDGDGNYEVSASEKTGVHFDLNDDGIRGLSAVDTNGDGYNETYIADLNGDGNPDINAVDSDGDESFDKFLVDLNGDGLADIDVYDSDGDGKLDFDVNWRSVIDASLNFFSDLSDDPFESESYTFDEGEETDIYEEDEKTDIYEEDDETDIYEENEESDIYEEGEETDIYEEDEETDIYEEGGEDIEDPSNTPEAEHGYLLDTNDVPETDSFTFDVNKDGVNDGVAYDTDGDGVADTYYYDYHGNDGKIDTVGYDLNHDGGIDTIAYDTNLDGHFDMVGYDSDGDNLMDGDFAYDADGDGVFDLTRLPAGPDDDTPETVEPSEPEPETVEPSEPEPEYVEPTESEPEYVEPTEPEPEYVEPTEPEPEYVEPVEEDNYTTHDIRDENMRDLMNGADKEFGYSGSNQVTYFIDSDGDGQNDVTIRNFDHDGDGNYDTTVQYYDTDGDGNVDQIIRTELIDTDGKGGFDTYEESIDADNDGTFEEVRVYDYDNDTADKDLITIYNDIDASAFEADSTDPMYYNEIKTFDPDSADPDKVIGNPEAAMELWESQGNTGRCGIFAQKFIIEQYTGREVPIEELVQKATEHGWFWEYPAEDDPNDLTNCSGTSLSDSNKLLELYGVPTEMGYNYEFNDIVEALQSGKHIVVSIDADEIWEGEQDDVFSPADGNNHAVDVIGVDYTDPENPMVILNDSGHWDINKGRGELVPLDTFLDAWDDSNNHTVIAG